MLPNALFKRLPWALGSTKQSTAAFGSSASGFSSRFTSESENPSVSTNTYRQSFQVPSLRNGFSMWHGLSSREAESERKENTSPTLFSQRRSFGALTAPSFASSRAIHALASRSTPLGLGLGLPSRPLPHSSPAPSSARTYGSQGELIGAAYLLTTDIMFWSGLIGAVVFRRNLIVMLLCTEIVMLAANMNFLFASAYLNDMTGVIMSITITTIAACETAIGLALCVTYFHIRSATDVEALNLLK